MARKVLNLCHLAYNHILHTSVKQYWERWTSRTSVLIIVSWLYLLASRALSNHKLEIEFHLSVIVDVIIHLVTIPLDLLAMFSIIFNELFVLFLFFTKLRDCLTE